MLHRNEGSPRLQEEQQEALPWKNTTPVWACLSSRCIVTSVMGAKQNVWPVSALRYSAGIRDSLPFGVEGRGELFHRRRRSVDT